MILVSQFSRIGTKYGIDSVFRDFVQMCVSALCVGNDEKAYFDVIKKYEKSDLNELAKMFGELVLEYDKYCDSPRDILGEIFEEIGLCNERNGQFFTPQSVCDLMANMTISGDQIEKKSVNDCAIGSGRTILSIKRVFDKVPKLFLGIDIDLRACHMSVINLYLNGFKGYVVHGDALSLECWKIYCLDPGKPISVIYDSDFLKRMYRDKKKPKVIELPLIPKDLFA